MIKFLQTPGKMKKFVLGGLLLLICVTMVITLIPGGFLGDAFGFNPESGVLAKVGNQEVTLTELQNTARNIQKQQRLPGELMPLIMEQTLQSLVTRKMLVYEAERMGLKVTKDEVRNELRRSPQLFPNGQFIGEQAYEGFVNEQYGMSAPQFEKMLQDEMLMRKLGTVITAGVTVSDSEIQQEFQRRNTKVKFDYAVLSIDDVEKQINPTDAELKAFYEKNRETRYKNTLPEKRQAQLILIDATKLASAQVTPEDLKRYYSQHQDEFRVQDRVNVSHMLVKTPPPGPDGKQDQKAVDAARAKAEGLLAQVKKGASFADLAKKNSDDTVSAEKGGSLGWIERGQTVPEFEKAAFGLNKGQTSELVQSSFGFHIIKVDDKQTAHLRSLDEVRAEIEPRVAVEKSAQEAERLATNVQASARTVGLDEAAKKYNLSVTNTGLIARTDSLPDIGTAPELMTAIFSVRAKDPAQTQRIPQGYAVFQVTDVQPPATPTFEQAKSTVEADFKRERAAQLLQQKVQELADRSRAENNLRAAAKAVGATVKTSELVTIQQQVPDLGAMSGPASGVFGMKPGEITPPVQTARGGAVLTLIEKQEPAATELAAQKDQIRDSVLDERRNQSMQVFLAELRNRLQKEGKLKINEKEVQRIAGGGGPAAPGM